MNTSPLHVELERERGGERGEGRGERGERKEGTYNIHKGPGGVGMSMPKNPLMH